ncbi:MAG: HEPN domain-containing protein [Candidatus Kapaibacterium sp.]
MHYLLHIYALKKLIKAHWVKDNDSNVPPKVHNLVYLVKQTKLFMTDEHNNFLAVFNDFQIQGRYPDYKFRIKQLLSEAFVNQIVKQFDEVRSCMLKIT